MELCYSQPNVINIFTDVSTLGPTEDSFICSGFIAIQDKRVLYSDFRVLNGSSSQFGELYAIMMGLTFMNTDVWSKRNRGLWNEVDNSVYNLFSDSVYALYCLKNNLSNWVSATNQAINNYTHPTFDYQSTTPPDLIRTQIPNKKVKKNSKLRKVIVPNQEVMLHCMGLIVYTQKQINMYHIKGHMAVDNPHHMDIARKDFAKFNPGVECTDEELKDMLYWNNLIDTTSREHLHQLVKCSRNLPHDVKWPVRFYPTQYQQMLYKKFIR